MTPKTIMFNFSGGELLIVGIVALIALGPKQLPSIARYLGQGLKKWQFFTNKIKKEITEAEKHQKLAENEQRAKAADSQYKTSVVPTEKDNVLL